MPHSLHNDPLFAGEPALARVPHLNQYWGAWALEESYARFLVSHCRNLNLQLHLEQHVGERAAEASSGGERGKNGYWINDNGIAVIQLSGTLMKHVSSMTHGTSLVLARRQVREAASDVRVAGILLVIDSPGGTVAGTADLAADIRAAGSKKPLFAYIEDVGASGAYWLASQAERVSASATSIVGSIGVFTVVEDSSAQAEADGVKVHVIRYGAMKGAGTPGTPVTDEQLAHLQERVDGFGEDFVAAIASGRKLSREAAAALADGRVHKAPAALKLRLIDAVESIDAALAAVTAATKKTLPSARTKVMSNTDAAAATEPTKPLAATLAELKENCVGAGAEFLMAQLEHQATLSQAIKAHAKQLSDANAALAKERDDLQAKAAEADKKPRRGVAPLAADRDDAQADDVPWAALGANEFMRCEIESRVAKGQPRERAAKSVFAAHPGLQDAIIAEANEHRRQK